MDRFLEFLVDNFITFFCIGLIGLFIYLMISVGQEENEARENTRRLTEACYSQGLILVETDAGRRCADPRTLVKVQ